MNRITELRFAVISQITEGVYKASRGKRDEILANLSFRELIPYVERALNDLNMKNLTLHHRSLMLEGRI